MRQTSLRADARDRLRVEDIAERAGREHVHIAEQNITRRNHVGGYLFAQAHEILAVDVGDEQLCARLVKQLAKVYAHVTDALDGDGDAFQCLRTEAQSGRCLDAPEHPESGPG